ncbi:type II secretion system minor pseudopilin GspK [Caenimonas koreensis]|uniref:type II secretion system minor pseudopilin GspK n=1 Tax=Caenimonas koreensis TaxID=367474 RepID=UPI00378336CF
MGRRKTSSGAALLMAMLTVALVAVFASSALWQQWRALEVERAERVRVQAGWILAGAFDWARLVLREDARAGSVDHLAEPWAVGLQESRLSEFLAAQGGTVSDAGADMLEAFLSGQITDLQSRLNITNLIADGRISQADVRSFERLFESLSLPPSELQTIVDNLLLAASRPTGDAAAQGKAPLMPTRIEQLAWLGASQQTIATLRPYVTVLPARTSVNINTASAEVIHAAVDGLGMSDARRLVEARARAPFRTLAEAKKVLGGAEGALGDSDAAIGVASRFFEISARLRLDGVVVEERCVVERDVLNVQPLWVEKVLAPA